MPPWVAGASSSQPQGSDAGAAIVREARPKRAVKVWNFIFGERDVKREV
jgi:hypothetical protein